MTSSLTCLISITVCAFILSTKLEPLVQHGPNQSIIVDVCLLNVSICWTHQSCTRAPAFNHWKQTPFVRKINCCFLIIWYIWKNQTSVSNQKNLSETGKANYLITLWNGLWGSFRKTVFNIECVPMCEYVELSSWGLKAQLVFRIVSKLLKCCGNWDIFILLFNLSYIWFFLLFKRSFSVSSKQTIEWYYKEFDFWPTLMCIKLKQFFAFVCSTR